MIAKAIGHVATSSVGTTQIRETMALGAMGSAWIENRENGQNPSGQDFLSVGAFLSIRMVASVTSEPWHNWTTRRSYAVSGMNPVGANILTNNASNMAMAKRPRAAWDVRIRSIGERSSELFRACQHPVSSSLEADCHCGECREARCSSPGIVCASAIRPAWRLGFRTLQNVPWRRGSAWVLRARIPVAGT